MFNNILIDKIKISSDEDIKWLLDLDEIKEALSEYFPKRAYIVKDSYLKNTLQFTPTRFGNNNFVTDTNVEMPNENELRRLFLRLGFFNLEDEITKQINISTLHLTKNIILNDKVPLYINKLKIRKYTRLKPITNKSNKTNTSLVLTNLKKDVSEKDYIGDKKILFYDKVQELQNKAKLDCISLKYGLIDDEIQLLPNGAYNAETRELLLKKLNILRVELQYKNAKMANLVRHIENRDNSKHFTLYLFLQLLDKGKLYSTLEEVYCRELIATVFRDKPNTDVKLNKYERLLQQLISKVDLSTILSILEYGEYNSKTYNLLKKLQKSGCNYYDEIYNKLGFSRF